MRRLLIVSFLVTVSLAPSLSAAKQRAVQHRTRTEIHLGALLSLTGDGSSLGAASAAALELAVRDINRELDELHTPWHVVAHVEDTQLDAVTARLKIESLHAAGVRLVIGPQTSSEAAAVLPFANEHDVVVVSQASTASTLAIAGDHLFRLAPNDRLEGIAQAALLDADAIDAIIPMWRTDAGNSGLKNGTQRAFEALGGVVHAGVPYDPATSDFSTHVAALGAVVRGAKNANPTARLAVYLASFEEAVAILRLARLDSDLSSIRWYGADGVTQSQALVSDADAAAFAIQTQFVAPNVGLDASARDAWEPILEEIRMRIGFAPDAYALSVYDAAWVAVLSAIEVGSQETLLRDSFERNVQRYWGITGPTVLDTAGDRRIGNFDFWTIRSVDGSAQWVRTAQFNSGRLVR